MRKMRGESVKGSLGFKNQAGCCVLCGLSLRGGDSVFCRRSNLSSTDKVVSGA